MSNKQPRKNTCLRCKKFTQVAECLIEMTNGDQAIGDYCFDCIAKGLSN